MPNTVHLSSEEIVRLRTKALRGRLTLTERARIESGQEEARTPFTLTLTIPEPLRRKIVHDIQRRERIALRQRGGGHAKLQLNASRVGKCITYRVAENIGCRMLWSQHEGPVILDPCVIFGQLGEREREVTLSLGPMAYDTLADEARRHRLPIDEYALREW